MRRILIALEGGIRMRRFSILALAVATLAPALGLLGAAPAYASGPGNYAISQTGYGWLNGTTDIGLYGDDATEQVNFPFPVSLYGTTYSSVMASTNGALDFAGGSNPNAFANGSLPTTDFGPSIMPNWDDLYMTQSYGQGVFTGVYNGGNTFVIEWRAAPCCSQSPTTSDFEVVFNNGSPNFTMQYANNYDNGSSSTIGVQAGSAGPSATYNYDQPGTIYNGLAEQYTYSPGTPPNITTNTNRLGFHFTNTQTLGTTVPTSPKFYLDFLASESGASLSYSVYVDGALAASGPANNGPKTTTSPFRVGTGYHTVELQVYDTQGDTSEVDWHPTINEPQNPTSHSTGWTTYTRTGLWGGSAWHTSTYGASATFSFSGTNVAYIGTMGPSMSASIKVYVDGVLIKTINGYSSTNKYRQLLFRWGWDYYASHTIKIVNAQGGRWVDVDGFVTAS
jgi:hypothetical protein